ncbi:homoserine dehydrogenase [Effusibacillus pohliae]|uniref:homoserine dehydrogenase n=1 Tax=Effusibacillus pohliae TaxID=232270 RepID=UPI0003636A8B|nr:homoserine dehydrogenase [Effusibacillus pohliae]
MNGKPGKQTKTVQVGLLGLGTVGSGIVKALQQNSQSIAERTGCTIDIPYILVRDPQKERSVQVDPVRITTDPGSILRCPDIQVVIEVMGGVEPARTILLEALRSGKHVITANKELLAKHGSELLRVAEESGVQLLFEASVAGGIPVIRFLQGYLTANQVHEVCGILNGTTNYILTQMEQTGRSFAEVLAQAQELGYAEADPTSDVEGYDAAYKLAILTNLAYDVHVSVDEIPREGITRIQPLDLRWAREFGYTIKLIGRSRKTERGVELSVGPRLLPFTHPLARVNDVFNAVTISSDVVGDLTFIGKGAGEYPTASAVLEDLTALLRQPGRVLRSCKWDVPVQRCEADDGCQYHFVRIRVPQSVVAEAEQKIAQLLIGQGGAILQEARAATGDRTVCGLLVGGLSGRALAACLRQLPANLLAEPPLVIACVEETASGNQVAAASGPSRSAKQTGELVSQTV